MVVKKGRVMYIPPVVLDEVEDIRREDELDKNSEAFRKLIKYARVGRETKRLANLKFGKSVPRPPVDNYPFGRSKGKGKKSNLWGVF